MPIFSTDNHLERDAVRDLGIEIGFGNMMHLAREVWRDFLDKQWGVPGGEFAVGPCVFMTMPCGCDKPGECQWCCGSGWLTAYVKGFKDQHEAQIKGAEDENNR